MSISLGNGGTYVNGHTYYNFKPYKGNVGNSFKRADIPGVGRQVWARMEDRGEDVEARTFRDAEGVALVILPRFAIYIPGWGSDTAGSELIINSDDIDAELFNRLFAELSNG